MEKKVYIPERGDIVWVDFDPTKGHEQSGRRPALVVSPRTYNAKSGLVLLCPITSRIKEYPYEVIIRAAEKANVILTDQLKSLDWKARRIRLIAKADHKTIREVQEKISTLIG